MIPNFSFSIKRFQRNRFAIWGGIYILFLFLLSLFGRCISLDKSEHANHQNLAHRFKKPGYQYQKKSSVIIDTLITASDWLMYSKNGAMRCRDSVTKKCAKSMDRMRHPSKADNEYVYYLGSDALGRDVLSRLVLGTKVSIQVGIIAVLISLLIGVFVGSMAGFYGGVIDSFVLWLMNVFWAIPTILLAMVLLMSFNSNTKHQIWLVFLAVGLTMWVDTARLIRGLFMQLRERQFVEAARALGFSNIRIIFRHILPNTIPFLIVITASNFATAILMESGLSYLGLGVQPPAPSWGSMLREYYGYLGTDVSYLAFFPGIAITLAVLAFYALGNGLRDALDVKG